MYHVNMQLRWNPEKNEILKATRNVSFEQVAEEIECGKMKGRIHK